MSEKKVNPWVELLLETEEMRGYQREFFKAKPKDKKLLMAKSKLCEMKVDQLIRGLRELCTEKGIKLIKEDESTLDD